MIYNVFSGMLNPTQSINSRFGWRTCEQTCEHSEWLSCRPANSVNARVVKVYKLLGL